MPSYKFVDTVIMPCILVIYSVLSASGSIGSRGIRLRSAEIQSSNFACIADLAPMTCRKTSKGTVVPFEQRLQSFNRKRLVFKSN